jgi:hypothetical protein
MSVHVSAAPSGVMTVPSASTTDPLGTWHTWTFGTSQQPVAPASGAVTAPGGTLHAGFDDDRPPPAVSLLEQATHEHAATHAVISTRTPVITRET